jgi:hypothetical protein
MWRGREIDHAFSFPSYFPLLFDANHFWTEKEASPWFFFFFGTLPRACYFHFTKANATDWELREERTREEGELYGFFFTT